MSEKTRNVDPLRDFLEDAGRPLSRHADPFWLRRYLEAPVDIFQLVDVPPLEQLRGVRKRHDPLLEAIVGRARERAITSAQLVTLGTLSYVHADDFPYQIERYIPIDIYLEETDVPALLEIHNALREFVETLGFEYFSYPSIVKSSARARAAAKTTPMMPKELKETEIGLAKGLQVVDGKTRENSTEGLSELLEIAKRQQELKLIKQQRKTSRAEEKKFDAERAASVMDKRNKLASILLKTAGAVSITIGTIVMASGGPVGQSKPPAEPQKVERKIETHSVGRTEHLKQLGEFLKKIGEQGKEENEGE